MRFVKVTANFDGMLGRVGHVAADSTDRMRIFRGVSQYCSTTNTWRKSDLCFGELKTGIFPFSQQLRSQLTFLIQVEEDQAHSELTPEQVKQVGSMNIRVTCHLHIGNEPRGLNQGVPKVISEIGETMLKGVPIANTI